jgi:tripartite-type tricarboxylate transporter receptor subunit TctC
MKLFSEVPTIRESGYDYAIDALFMLAAPKGTPLPIVKKLDDAFQKAMDDPEFIRYMEKAGIDISYRNHEDTKKSLEEAYVRLGKVIAELKLPKEPEKK